MKVFIPSPGWKVIRLDGYSTKRWTLYDENGRIVGRYYTKKEAKKSIPVIETHEYEH